MATPHFRLNRRRLPVAALAVALLVAASPWVKLTSTLTPNARGVALSFYPVTVPAVRLNVSVTKDQVEAWGTAGKIKVASAADGVVAFEAPTEVAELQIRAPARGESTLKSWVARLAGNPENQ